ncbi:MAG: ATP-binding protein, partial [Planctomycetes bacterium]|nr:ATP-binding protein [Planctomycetota bacterium]
DQQRLSQVLVNLLTNACDASQVGDNIEIFASAHANEVKIEIMDHGKGIPDHMQEYIFEPFFTTKAPGDGTGLGLSMAHKIIQEHSGNITIDSEPDVGTRVEIRLPQTNNPDNQQG